MKFLKLNTIASSTLDPTPTKPKSELSSRRPRHRLFTNDSVVAEKKSIPKKKIIVVPVANEFSLHRTEINSMAVIKGRVAGTCKIDVFNLVPYQLSNMNE